MAARSIPFPGVHLGALRKKVGNRSYDELQKLLKDRLRETSTAPTADKTVDLRKVPGSNERRTGIPADVKSRSARGTIKPALSRGPVQKGQRYFPEKPTNPTQLTYRARGKTYTANPMDRTDIFLKNHPTLAGLKGPSAKARFLRNHPKISKRASEVSRSGNKTLPYTPPGSPITKPKGPALARPTDNYRAAILRRMRKAKR